MKLRSLWLPYSTAALVCLAAGCGDSSSPPVSSNSPAPSPKNQEHSFVRIFNWDEYLDESVLEKFTEQTGIEVLIESFEDTDEVNAAIRSRPDHYDIVVIDSDKAENLWDLQLLRELDHSQLPNLKHIDSTHLARDADAQSRFSVPYLWGTTLVAYRKDMIEDPIRSWGLLWDDRYAGRIGMLNERLESVQIALIKNGYSLNERSPQAIQLAEKDLIAQVQGLGVRYLEGIPSVLEQALTSGQIWAAAAYSGDAAMIADEHENIGLFIPKEGSALWIDTFVIPRDSPRHVEAHQFINYFMDPKMAAANASSLYYATPNRAAREFLDPELLQDEAIFPPDEVMEKCELAAKATSERERPVNLVWGRVMAAYDDLAQTQDTPPREHVSQGATEESH